METRIAYFISPHGFGHAARACSVMESLQALLPQLAFSIFTTVPKWFFEHSLSGPFSYYSLLTDVGLVQTSPLHEDIEATLEQLAQLYPLDMASLGPVMASLSQESCDLIICDIAPMGIQIGKELGIPSLLIENFTWDWIYQGYPKFKARFYPYVKILQALFADADYHIQAEPFCQKYSADLVTRPIARRPRQKVLLTREKLGIPLDKKLVAITMGGIPETYRDLATLQQRSDLHFLVPGGSEQLVIRENMIFLPPQSGFYHPDLIEASDVIIGKIGYSTLAEIYQAGKPFGFITRDRFRESPKLEAYILAEMSSQKITEQAYQAGTWIKQIDGLLSQPELKRSAPSGAEQAADFILTLLAST